MTAAGSFAYATSGGQVHFLQFHNLPIGAIITTATEKTGGELRIDCGACRHNFSVPNTTSDALQEVRAQSDPACLSHPCLMLPPAAWLDTRLTCKCPHCHAALKLNPFILDDDTSTDCAQVHFVGMQQRPGDGVTFTYEIYRAGSQEQALLFLRDKVVDAECYYVEVETPGHVYGRDINGVYDYRR